MIELQVSRNYSNKKGVYLQARRVNRTWGRKKNSNSRIVCFRVKRGETLPRNSRKSIMIEIPKSRRTSNSPCNNLNNNNNNNNSEEVSSYQEECKAQKIE